MTRTKHEWGRISLRRWVNTNNEWPIGKNIDLTRKENHSRRNVKINICLSYKSNWINLSRFAVVKPCYRKSSESLCPSGVQKARAEDRGWRRAWVVVVQGYELDGLRQMRERVGDTANKAGTCRWMREPDGLRAPDKAVLRLVKPALAGQYYDWGTMLRLLVSMSSTASAYTATVLFATRPPTRTRLSQAIRESIDK